MRHLQQSGMSLIVALIMLLVMTSTTLMLFRMSNTGTQIVGNMQFRNEALAAADGTLQEVISTTRLVLTPAALFAAPCDGVANRRCYDLTGDGDEDLQVDVPQPQCMLAVDIPNADLDLTNPIDLKCAFSPESGSGDESLGAIAGASKCARAVWEARANAEDYDASGTTGARMTIVQGVGVLIGVDRKLIDCPGS